MSAKVAEGFGEEGEEGTAGEEFGGEEAGDSSLEEL